MFLGIEPWQLAVAIVAGITLFALSFFAAMARFLKRPSPSEAIIRIGRATTEVFIGRAAWIVPVLHRSATLSLSTIGLQIRRAGQDALVSKDYISTNLSAEFYIRVEPNDGDVRKAARTIGIDEGQASTDKVRAKAQQLLEPKLVGALRAVAAQNEFLALHLNREHFAQEVSNALREDLGRNGFTLESVTITDLTQTPLADMREDDIFGASGRETVTHTVVAKNIAVRRKLQEEAQRTAEIQREQEIRVAEQHRLTREGKAQQEEAAVKAELAQSEAIEVRDLQRQASIALERSRKEQSEQAAEIEKQRAIESALVQKEKAVEAAQVDKQITLVLKAKEQAEAEAQRAAALAELERANQEVTTVEQVAEAERASKVALVAASRAAQEQRLEAEVASYRTSQGAQGDADAARLKAQAEADAAQLQAEAIVRLATARREAGLYDAEVAARNIQAANGKSPQVLVQEMVLAAIARAPELVRELVKPAEKIGELKVVQLQGGPGAGGASGNHVLGSALGPIAKTLLETSAVLPLVQSALQLTDLGALRDAARRLTETPAEEVTPQQVLEG